MPRTCSICKSQRRSEIEAELIRGEAYRSVAKQYGCSAPSVFRHKNGHLPEKLTLAKRHRETLSAEGLLGEMAGLKTRLQCGLEHAEKGGNAAAFVAFAREFRQCLESYFEMSERIAAKNQVGSANGRGLAEMIAKARARVERERVPSSVVEARIVASKEVVPAETLGPVPSVNPPSMEVLVKPQQQTTSVKEYDDWVDRLVRHSR